MSSIKVTVTFKMEEAEDTDPDLSYLEQSYDEVESAIERARYRRQDLGRLAAYQMGDWRMIGIRAVATIWIQRGNYSTNYELQSPGLYGIESDSGSEYLKEVFDEECATLRADIEAMKNAEFKS